MRVESEVKQGRALGNEKHCKVMEFVMISTNWGQIRGISPRHFLQDAVQRDAKVIE